MTDPFLQNCPHSPSGWCLDCVAELRAALECEKREYIKLHEELEALQRLSNIDRVAHAGLAEENERLIAALKAEREAREEAERIFIEIRDKHQAEFLRAEAAEARVRELEGKNV